jgi:hypothetical protein
MIRWLAVSCVTVGLLAGCKTDPECERARMKLSKTWHDLHTSATRRKLSGVDVDGWAFVEKQTDLLESSFATTQITWDSADNARKALAARASGLQSDTETNANGFKLSLDAAFKEQDAFSNKCR